MCHKYRKYLMLLQNQHHKCKSNNRTINVNESCNCRREFSDTRGHESSNNSNSQNQKQNSSTHRKRNSSARNSGVAVVHHSLPNIISFNFNFKCLMVFIMLSSLCTRTGCDDTENFQKNIPARVIWAAVDRSAELPCDITPPSQQDSVKLVLWFKGATGIPLYSLDSRNGVPLVSATHSALASDLGQRLYFSATDAPKDAKLQIRDVKSTDGGVYRCRVDFFNSPTRNYRFNLTLVVPPEEPRIFDAQGKEIAGVAGPFREGHELFLSCQVTGGRPPPKVSWWRDKVEIAGVSHPSADEGYPAMVNQLFIGTVTRDMFGAKFECRAQGSKLIPAVVKEVTIQVHLKPVRVKIVSSNALLTAGRPTPIKCETYGSYPAAKITWLLDGEPLRSADTVVNTEKDDANVTVSVLTLRVTAENDGAELTCRSTNPWISGGALEDKRIISVAYPPTVSVHLANEDPSRVVTRSEGQNVTLKCRADAKPAVTSYSWYKNGMRMSGESTETLYLIYLERESAGIYACAAANTEGDTRSSTLTLKVQFSPRCKPGTEQTSVGALNMHSISVKCEVDADPPESIKFSWTYNNTRNVSPVTNSRITSHGLISAMTYLPQSDAELITLACWASNEVGRQQSPCLIHILPAKIPETPKLCELHNDTVLEVVCTAGFDGGLAQHFLLEVVGGTSIFSSDTTRSSTSDLDNEISTMNDQATLAPLFRLEETTPQFKLHNLEAGRDYQFMVYAVNAKGKSDPPYIIDRVRIGSLPIPYDETIMSEDPTPAETSTNNHEKQQQQSQLIILAAVIGTIVIIILSVIVISIVALCKQRRPKPPEPQEVRKRMRPARTDVPSMYAEDDGFEDEFTRPADINRASTIRSSGRYISEGFVQYSQPSLNDPDLILPRGDIEFTTIGGA